MSVGERVQFERTGARGVVEAEVDHLTPFDGDLGPWSFVAFDEGFHCWVQRHDLILVRD